MSTDKKQSGFSEAEREAMKERTKELRAEARLSKNREEGERVLLEAVKAMPKPDRDLAARIHEIVKKNAPMLFPKTWYGMPAYANQDGKVICFFQSADKFKARYATFGFNDMAKLDKGNMWPTSFALVKLSSAEESIIAELVKKAVS
jgi:uncharacterized protein YdhG (YjbR/CyaY superfamily)